MSFLHRTFPGPFRWAVLLASVLLVSPGPLVAPGPLAAGSAAPLPAAAPSGAAAAAWVWPTSGRVVLRPFDADATEYGPGHRGIDIAAPGLTDGADVVVAAPAAGSIAFSGQVAGRPVVTIDHGGGLVSTLDHVLAMPGIEVGTPVERGAPVGRLMPGHCDPVSPCLHLGARLDGRYVDPLLLLPRAAWPVLLPRDRWPERN